MLKSILTSGPVRRIKLAGKIVLNRERVVRGYTFFDDDIFLVSYPKSGNTWTRFLLANLVHADRTVDLRTIERLVPELYINDDVELARAPRPRILKTHNAFDPRYRRVIYVVRDPRDVAVSYFHYAKKMGRSPDDETIEAFVERFILGRVDTFGSWGQNVGSWLGAREGQGDFIVVRYEDLIEDAMAQLDRIAEFLGQPRDRDRLERAIELSSVDRLRSLESKQGKDWKMARHGDANRSFFRSGKSGGWRNELPEPCARRIARTWARQMALVGYEP